MCQSTNPVVSLPRVLPLSLRYLRAFYQVYQCGSISDAGKVLMRAQSAVTRAVARLEEELQAPLFERSARGMLPTQFGDVLFARVERALTCMRIAADHLVNGAGGKKSALLYELYLTERQLAVLIGLKTMRNMGAVAVALGISQPAVSQILRELEGRCGLQLFERTVRGVSSTEAGDILVTQLSLALNEMRIAIEELSALRNVKKAEVRVGVLSLGSAHLLPVSATRLLKKNPGIKISTMEGSFETLAAALRSGDIDLLVGALRPPEYTRGFSREIMFEDELVLVVRGGHPLSGRTALQLADLADAQWAVPQSNTSTRTMLEKAVSERGAGPLNVVLESTDIGIIKEAVLGSDIVTAVSAHQLLREIRMGILACLPVTLPESRRPIGVLRRVDDSPSPAVQMLLAEMNELSRTSARHLPEVLPGA